MAGQVINLAEVTKQARKERRPRINFGVRHHPMELQLCGMFPVLPNETLKKLTIQSRAVTSPVRSALSGWWLEYYVFYVSHRQMNNQAYMDMILDPTVQLPTSANSNRHAYWGRGHNWALACEQTIVKNWFRDEGEEYEHSIRENRPLVKMQNDNILDSYTMSSELPAGDITGIETFDEMEKFQQIYNYLRGTNFTKMSYEDFLESYGVKSRTIDAKRPELLRVIKEWQLPNNTVNPADGTVASAVSWVINESADKDRYFTEPGFIVVYSVARPKMFPKKLLPSTPFLDNAMAWMPAVMLDQPETSLREFTNTTGPVEETSNLPNYWLDMRDLYTHGDQFLDLSDWDDPNVFNKVDLPRDANKKYLYETDINQFFTGGGNNRFLRQDGVLQAHILGTQMDMT